MIVHQIPPPREESVWENHPQIVIYSKESIDHKGKIEVTGEVVAVGHEATDENVKIKEEFWEYHMLVDTWKSLE